MLGYVTEDINNRAECRKRKWKEERILPVESLKTGNPLLLASQMNESQVYATKKKFSKRTEKLSCENLNEKLLLKPRNFFAVSKFRQDFLVI